MKAVLQILKNNRSKLFGLMISLVVLVSCNGSEQPEKEPETKFDSIILKIDSLTDTIGHEIKDVNEGAKEGVKELKDSIQGEGSIY